MLTSANNETNSKLQLVQQWVQQDYKTTLSDIDNLDDRKLTKQFTNFVCVVINDLNYAEVNFEPAVNIADINQLELALERQNDGTVKLVLGEHYYAVLQNDNYLQLNVNPAFLFLDIIEKNVAYRGYNGQKIYSIILDRIDELKLLLKEDIVKYIRFKLIDCLASENEKELKA